MEFDNKYVTIATGIFQEKRDMEAVIATLKKQGANQMQTTQAICLAVGMRLAEVDKIVLNSPSWSDQRDYNLKIRDQFFDNE